MFGLLNVLLWSQSYSVPKALVLKTEMLYTSKCQILAPLSLNRSEAERWAEWSMRKVINKALRKAIYNSQLGILGGLTES